MKHPTKKPAPPAHLSICSRKLWADVVEPNDDPRRLAFIQCALEARDRADQARALIDREGLTITTARSGVAHVHPATRVEKESRQQFVAIWAKLGFDCNRYRPPDPIKPEPSSPLEASMQEARADWDRYLLGNAPPQS